MGLQKEVLQKGSSYEKENMAVRCCVFDIGGQLPIMRVS
jgi:hypothetical protein